MSISTDHIPAGEIAGINARKILIWAFIILLLDGYDVGAISYAAPSLLKAWGLDRAALGPMFSASLFGVLIGAPLFGYLGDRFGRKRQIILGSILFGAFSLLTMWASSLNEVIALRLLAGLGLGAVPPNVYSLVSELTPKRQVRTAVILASTGITLGAALPGAVTAWLVPVYGWQVLFLIGGVLPVLVAACLAFVLPESPRFETRAKPDENHTVRASQLFAAQMLPATLLLWLLFILHAFVFFFLFSWLPILIGSAGVPMNEAVVVSMLLPIGGTLSGLALAKLRLLERGGLLFLAGLFLFSALAIASLGSSGESRTLLMLAVFVAGFCFNGLQFCLNATATVLYPPNIRALGLGWASGMARVGSIAGPIVGGVLLGTLRLPLSQLYLCAAVPMVLAAVATVALVRVAPSSLNREVA